MRVCALSGLHSRDSSTFLAALSSGCELALVFLPAGPADRRPSAGLWAITNGSYVWHSSTRVWPLNETRMAAWLADPTKPKLVWGPDSVEAAFEKKVVVRGYKDMAVSTAVLTCGDLPLALTRSLTTHNGLALVAKMLLKLDVPVDTDTYQGEVQSAVLGTVALRHVAAALRSQLCKAELERTDSLEQSVSRVLGLMERTGIPVDPALWWKICDKATTAASAHARRARDSFANGVPVGWNIASDEQIKAALAADNVTLPNGRHDKVSVDRSVLSKVQHPAAQEILAWRNAHSLAVWRDKPVCGRLRPRWHVLGASTGRISTVDPNVLAIPAPLSAAVVADPGMVILAGDFRNQEMAILASLSGDEALKEAIASGDPYRALANKAGVPRHVAKTVFLAVAYGASQDEIARVLGCSRGQAARIVTALRATFPAAMHYCGQVRAVQPADIDSPLLQCGQDVFEVRGGGRRRLTSNLSGPRVGNTPIQATAATMLKQALVAACRPVMDLGGAVLLAIHDELVVEVPDDHADKASTVIREAMTAAALSSQGVTPGIKLGVGDSVAQARKKAI